MSITNFLIFTLDFPLTDAFDVIQLREKETILKL